MWFSRGKKTSSSPALSIWISTSAKVRCNSEASIVPPPFLSKSSKASRNAYEWFLTLVTVEFNRWTTECSVSVRYRMRKKLKPKFENLGIFGFFNQTLICWGVRSVEFEFVLLLSALLFLSILVADTEKCARLLPYGALNWI